MMTIKTLINANLSKGHFARKNLNNARKYVAIDSNIKADARNMLEEARSTIGNYAQSNKNINFRYSFKDIPSKHFDSIIRIEAEMYAPNKVFKDNTDIAFEGENKLNFLKKIYKNIEKLTNDGLKRIIPKE